MYLILINEISFIAHEIWYNIYLNFDNFTVGTKKKLFATIK